MKREEKNKDSEKEEQTSGAPGPKDGAGEPITPDEEQKETEEAEPSPEEKYAEMEGKYKRALADYQNLLKRTAEEKREFVKFANERIIMEIIPVYDNLRVSLDHLDSAAKCGGWAEGIKHVIRQFGDILKDLGVEEIEAEGKPFDPNTMDALEGEGETVKTVVKPGYSMKGKVILPAKVVLG